MFYGLFTKGCSIAFSSLGNVCVLYELSAQLPTQKVSNIYSRYLSIIEMPTFMVHCAMRIHVVLGCTKVISVASWKAICKLVQRRRTVLEHNLRARVLDDDVKYTSLANAFY